MTFERYWNDKLCRSLKSPNLTGGPVARLGDSGHLGRNDSGTTIGTTFEQKPKNWRLRWLNRFPRSYALVCLSTLNQTVWPSQVDRFDTFLRIVKISNFKWSKGSKKSKIQNQAFFFYFASLFGFSSETMKKKVPKAFNFGDKIGQIYIKRARSRCKKS